MNNAHKHAEVIKAWADGKRVQVSAGQGCGWMDCDNPGWHLDQVYRVKPGVVKVEFRVYIRKSSVTGRFVADISNLRECVERYSDFVSWVGDWQEVEVSNG